MILNAIYALLKVVVNVKMLQFVYNVKPYNIQIKLVSHALQTAKIVIMELFVWVVVNRVIVSLKVFVFYVCQIVCYVQMVHRIVQFAIKDFIWLK